MSKEDILGKEENHESYGMVGISRVSSTPAANLFGSGIRHYNTIM